MDPPRAARASYVHVSCGGNRTTGKDPTVPARGSRPRHCKLINKPLGRSPRSEVIPPKMSSVMLTGLACCNSNMSIDYISHPDDDPVSFYKL